MIKNFIYLFILTISSYSLECNCPLQTGQEFTQEWRLISEVVLNEGKVNETTYGSLSNLSKEDKDIYSQKILSEYPKNEEETIFLKTIKGSKPKRILYCSETISVLPNGIKWTNYEKGKYKSNKYKIRTQKSFIKLGCSYCKGKNTNYDNLEGWEENPELYFQNLCSGEVIGSKAQCLDNNGLISMRHHNCCIQKSCFTCDKEDEDFEELLEDETIEFSWNSNEDLSDKCHKIDGKIEKDIKKCITKFRCVKQVL